MTIERKEDLVFKNLRINQNIRQCYINDEEVDLSKQEYNLLVFFIINPDYIFSVEELMDNVWTTDHPTRNAVLTSICKLRKVLRKGGMNNIIERRPGCGYFFKTHETKSKNSTNITD
jgi:DNA-binding response OmpR family regulator